jgi:magnesium transporter
VLKAYHLIDGQLTRMVETTDLQTAIWVDLVVPTAAEVTAVTALGVDVPTLQDMEEIEISNRLYRTNGTDFMTAVIPGHSGSQQATSGPVTFILSAKRLVTVRLHAARPFETNPARAHLGEAQAGAVGLGT